METTGRQDGTSGSEGSLTGGGAAPGMTSAGAVGPVTAPAGASGSDAPSDVPAPASAYAAAESAATSATAPSSHRHPLHGAYRSRRGSGPRRRRRINFRAPMPRLDVSAEMERLRRFRRITVVRRLWTLTSVIVSALLQAYTIAAFVRPAGLLSSGFTGLALLIERITGLFGVHFSTSLGMIALNIPVALICWRSISRRFVVFSLLQVALSSFFLHFFTGTRPLVADLMLQVVFGGFLYGFSIAVALRAGASTAGTDFISLMVSNRTGRSIWGIIFAGNCVVLGIFGVLFGWRAAAYSIIFQFISTKAIETFYHRYDRLTLQITTKRPDEVLGAYHEAFRHGSSCAEVIGGYSRERYWVITTVISSYELDDVLHVVRGEDERAVVNTMRTENFYGGFYRGPLDA